VDETNSVHLTNKERSDMSQLTFETHVSNYRNKLTSILDNTDIEAIEVLGAKLIECWKTGKQVFICGNGGSAGNAMHIANDLIYGISKKFGSGLKITALPANGSVVTCLANDEGYEHIFSYQLGVLGQEGDVLIALSGSGNSQNIVNVLQTAKSMNIETFAILGYSGGKAKGLADVPIHYAIDDMQISEDLQLIILHMLMQWLYQHKDSI
jgi:D-sedoheptulose 7-phosphate isomerase